MLKIREIALHSLKNRVRDATSLVICDPYILTSTNRQEEAEYVRELLGILPQNLANLVLVFSDTRENLGLRTILEAECPKHIKIHYLECDEIHDRVWIVNSSKAFVTGTSFNSIGYRLSFIIDLSKKDFDSFWEFLVRELGDDLKKVILENRNNQTIS